MNYKLEFNEEQQAFHLSTPANRLPDSNGWWTIMDSCSDQMYWEFICMLETLHNEPYNREKILDANAKLALFQSRLNNNRLVIMKDENVSVLKNITRSEDPLRETQMCLQVLINRVRQSVNKWELVLNPMFQKAFDDGLEVIKKHSNPIDKDFILVPSDTLHTAASDIV